LTCSEAIQERATQAVLDFGGVPVQQPLIQLVPVEFPNIGKFDWLIVTSPSSVRCLLSQVDDLRTLPKILCCGSGTAKALAEFHIQADAIPDGKFNTDGVLAAAQKQIPTNAKILRVRSDRAGGALAEKLRETFAHVEDVVICRNEKVVCDMPDCDAVLFASVSAVESFIEQFGADALSGKEVAAIGKLDAAELEKHGVQNVVSPKQSTVEGAVEALAVSNVWKEFSK
jgi:uroporphyrinogen-III synthase